MNELRMSEAGVYPHFKFGLLSAFLAMAICAASVRWFGWFIELFAMPMFIFLLLLFVFSWFVSRLLFVGYSPEPRTSKHAWMVRSSLATFVVAWIMAFACHHRWTHGFFKDPNWPRAFPFPDTILVLFHNWLDQRNPVEPGYFKIHGEFYSVLATLNLLLISVTVFIAVLCSLIVKRGSFANPIRQLLRFFQTAKR